MAKPESPACPHCLASAISAPQPMYIEQVAPRRVLLFFLMQSTSRNIINDTTANPVTRILTLLWKLPNTTDVSCKTLSIPELYEQY